MSHWARETVGWQTQNRGYQRCQTKKVGKSGGSGVLRSPKDKDTELGTMPTLSVWKDRDSGSMCPGDGRPQESKPAGSTFTCPSPTSLESCRITILSPHPSFWATASVTFQASRPEKSIYPGHGSAK